MEVPWPPLPVLFALLVLFLFMLCRIAGTGRSTAKLPPGPRGLPIIGSMHHLFTSLPHRSLRDLARQYGPLMHLKLGEVSTIVVSSPQMAKEVMKTHDLVFSYRPELQAAKVLTYGCVDIVFTPHGEYWRQLRKICILELLSAKRVQSFRTVREEEVGKLVRSIRVAAAGGPSRQPVNLTEKLYGLSSSVTSRVALGSKSRHHERFLEMSIKAAKLASGFNVADLFPSLGFVNFVSGMRFKLGRIHRELDGILDEIVMEHKNRKVRKMDEEEDLLDVLLRLQESGDLEFPLTPNNIKAVILLHIVAKTTGMHHNEWVENADRFVAGFLEKFEEGCHMMETAIKYRIQEHLRSQQSKTMACLLQEPVASCCFQALGLGISVRFLHVFPV